MLANEKTFREIVLAIRSVEEPEAIILYGSYARGSPSHNSDIDLLVVRKEEFGRGESRRKELGRLYRAVTAKCDVPKDIVLLTKDEVAAWRNTTNHMASEALREGRILYGQV